MTFTAGVRLCGKRMIVVMMMMRLASKGGIRGRLWY